MLKYTFNGTEFFGRNVYRCDGFLIFFVYNITYKFKFLSLLADNPTFITSLSIWDLLLQILVKIELNMSNVKNWELMD